MDLDSQFKRLVKELGQAINDSLSESERISEVLGKIRAAGYDLFLVLEVTVGFNKQGEKNLVHREKLNAESHTETAFRLNAADARFLRELKITVEEDGD